MNMRYTLTLIAFTCLFLSCHQNDKEIIVDVDKEFYIKPWENLNETGGNLQLQVETILKQSCPETSINYYVNVSGSKVIVTLRELYNLTPCFTANEAAHDTIDIEGLEKNKTYDFQLNLKDIVINKGSLTLQDDKYTINMLNENGISIPIKEVLRVPQNAVWGYIAFPNGQERAATQLIDSLKTITAPLSIADGNYGYFNMKDNKVTVLPKVISASKPNYVYFIYHINNKNRLQNIIETAHSTLDYTILTSNGKVFTK